MCTPPRLREDGLLELPNGIELELTLSAPPSSDTAANPKRLAVCLHPWSWLGGRMNDPVLRSLKGVLSDRGFHVLRYNSRGVGRSTGRSTFGGIDEGKDLESVVQWGIQEVGEVETVVIIGYSHGALIATLHPIALEQQHPHIKLAYVLLSYPLGPRSFLTLFKGSFYGQKLTDLISSGKSKILLAFGGRDEFTALDRYQLWVSDLEAKDSAAQSADEASNRQKTLRVLQVPEASHFWTGETNVLLRSELSQWLMSL